jgi:hypothetical protein
MTDSLLIVALSLTVATANGALLLLRRHIGMRILTSPLRDLLYIILHSAKSAEMLVGAFAIVLSNLFRHPLGVLIGGLQIRS